jgi:hypothetical protein
MEVQDRNRNYGSRYRRGYSIGRMNLAGYELNFVQLSTVARQELAYPRVCTDGKAHGHGFLTP